MSGYIGVQPVPQTTQTRDSFTATANQTSFGTSGYQVGFLDVYLNGVKLAAADFTATNGSDVVLATGAALNDILEVVAFSTFSTSNGTFTGTTTFDTVVVTNTVDGRDVSVDGAKLDTIPVISTSSTASFIAKGDGSSQDGYIQLNCYQNTHGIKLKPPPHSASASYTLTFPNDDGTANQLLSTDGSGVLSWATVSASDSTKLPLAGGAMTGAITTNSTFDGVDVGARDAVLTDTTTKATAALPKTGGAMTGAITTNSTFDGVDIATRDAVLTATTTTANAALPKAGGAMTGAITSASNLTLDAAGEIHLDADNSGVVRLKDGGTEFGAVFAASSNLNIKVQGAANDIIFSGNNAANNAAVTFLTLKGDAAGAATFNGAVSADNYTVAAGGVYTTASGNDLNLVVPDGRSIFLKEAGTTHVTVDNSGKVGIGCAPLAPLHVRLEGSGSVPVTVAKFETISNGYGRGPQLDFNVYWGSDIPTAKIAAPNVSGGNGYGGELRFSTNGNANANSMAERIRLDGDGLKFHGDTAAANALNDYEEGDWDPVFHAHTGSNPTYNIGFVQGSYTKIGRLVTVNYSFENFQVTGYSTTAVLLIAGLPYAIGAIGNGFNQYNGPRPSTYNVTFARTQLASRNYTGNRIGFFSTNNGGGWGWEYVNILGTAGTRYLTGSMTYHTDS